MNLPESVHFVLSQREIFGEHFYQRLLAQHPAMQTYFDGIDMSHQAVLLTMQLTVIEAYRRTQSPAAKKYLQILGTRHHERGIPQSTYAQFRDVLIETLQQFHQDDWTEELHAEWTDAINSASERMFEGYDRHFHM